MMDTHGVITLAQDRNCSKQGSKTQGFAKGINISLLMEEGFCFMQLDTMHKFLHSYNQSNIVPVFKL
jgi:hypothetical protein